MLWRRRQAQARASHRRALAHAAFSTGIAERQALVQRLSDALAERGLLQRQVRDGLAAAAHEAAAAYARVQLRPADRRILASLMQAESAYARAIFRTLDSVRPATLQAPRLDALVSPLTQILERLENTQQILVQCTPPTARAANPSIFRRSQRPRFWRTDAGWV
jgi:hypothetical protein